jgi:hypothetical protein
MVNSLTIKDMVEQIKTDEKMAENTELRIWKICVTTVQNVWRLIRK